jgi:hypothetical protein
VGRFISVGRKPISRQYLILTYRTTKPTRSKKLLTPTIHRDHYPLLPHIRTMKAILDKVRSEQLCASSFANRSLDPYWLSSEEKQRPFVRSKTSEKIPKFL